MPYIDPIWELISFATVAFWVAVKYQNDMPINSFKANRTKDLFAALRAVFPRIDDAWCFP